MTQGPLYLKEGAESQEQTRLPPHCRAKPFITLQILYKGRAKKERGGLGLGLKGLPVREYVKRFQILGA